MSKKKLPKLFRRKWLNKDKGSAYIIIDAEVEKQDWGKKKGSLNVDASIEIKDCHRQSELEFHYYDEQQYKARLKKIKLFIESLQDLEKFMKANPPVIVREKEEGVSETKATEGLEELLLETRYTETAPEAGKVIETGPVVLKPTKVLTK
jgi:hypothetical protein